VCKCKCNVIMSDFTDVLLIILIVVVAFIAYKLFVYARSFERQLLAAFSAAADAADADAAQSSLSAGAFADAHSSSVPPLLLESKRKKAYTFDHLFFLRSAESVTSLPINKKNVVAIDLVEATVPIAQYNVETDGNTYSVTAGGLTINFTMPAGVYTLDAFVVKMNSDITVYFSDMTVVFDTVTNKITIANPVNFSFTMHEKIGFLMGFTGVEQVVQVNAGYEMVGQNRSNFYGSRHLEIRSADLESVLNTNIIARLPFHDVISFYRRYGGLNRPFSIPTHIRSIDLSMYDDDDTLYSFNGLFYTLTFKVTVLRYANIEYSDSLVTE